MVDEHTWSTAHELSRRYRTRDLSPVDVVEASLARIAEVDDAINSMVTVTADMAREQAKVAERRFASGEDLPRLFGVPITVKDLVDTAGVRTTYGSIAYVEHIPTTDALAWARLKNTGAILIGKSTTPEFGLLGTTESALTGSTFTPWKKGHTSGGSSGGTAAAVAAGIAPLGWGSDGGGSIRVPAALCGAVGLKPSVGRVPHLNNSDSDGTEGPITRSVLDAALMLDTTSGRHARDRFTIPSTREVFADAAERSGDLKGWRIAATTNPLHGPVERGVAMAFEASLDVLRKLGASVDIVDLGLPDPHDYFVSYWGSEFAAATEELQELGLEVWPSIVSFAEQGKALSPLEVSRALREKKTEIYNAFANCFDSYDIVVTPTTPCASFLQDGDTGGPESVDGHVIEHPNTFLHRFTEAPSHAGVPAISVPAGYTGEGLPIGLQLIAPMYEDSRMIYAAARYEQATPWHAQHPTVHETDPMHQSPAL